MNLVVSNQVHMYRYSTYATVTVFAPIYLCVFVPAINTGVCMCVLTDGS